MINFWEIENTFISQQINHYGQMRRWRWFGPKNAERIHLQTIDTITINALEQKLARYEARNRFARFFQRWFTSIEKQRSLLCYWALSSLQASSQIHSSQQTKQAIRIISQYAMQVKSSRLNMLFAKLKTSWQQNSLNLLLEKTMLTKKLNMLCATMQYALWEIASDPTLTLFDRAQRMQERKKHLHKCCQSLYSQIASAKEKKQFFELYQQQQGVFKLIQEHYQELLHDPQQALIKTVLHPPATGAWKEKNGWSAYQNQLQTFLDAIARLMGIMRPTKQYLIWREQVKTYLLHSFKTLLLSNPAIAIAWQQAIKTVWEATAERFKAIDVVAAEWLNDWLALLPATTQTISDAKFIPEHSLALIKVTTPAIITTISMARDLDSDFAADLKHLIAEGKLLLQKTQAFKQNPTLAAMALDTEALKVQLGFQAFTKTYRQKLKVYHPDRYHGETEAKTTEARISRWTETYQNYQQRFYSILEGTNNQTNLIEQLVRSQARNQEILQENEKRLDTLAKEMKDLATDFKHIRQGYDQILQDYDQLATTQQQMLNDFQCMHQTVNELSRTQAEMLENVTSVIKENEQWMQEQNQANSQWDQNIQQLSEQIHWLTQHQTEQPSLTAQTGSMSC